MCFGCVLHLLLKDHSVSIQVLHLGFTGTQANVEDVITFSGRLSLRLYDGVL
jgi:hypothetical protein